MSGSGRNEPQYDVANAAESKVNTLVFAELEEEELKAAGGSQDDKPDNYLELAASELNKRRKSRK